MGTDMAEAWAEAVVGRFDLNPPVDVEALVRRLGIALARVELSRQFDGMLVEETPRRYLMVINRRHSVIRQRFTVAHELGHWLMHRDQLESVGASLRVRHRRHYCLERQANAFAAALLMPRRDVIAATRRGLPFDILVKRYQVSRQSLGYRLKDLGLLLPDTGNA